MNVLDGDIAFRRAYLRSVIDEVEIDDDEVQIHGTRSVGSGASRDRWRGDSCRSAQFCWEVARPAR